MKDKIIEEMAMDICNMCRDMYGVCDNKKELCPAIKAEMEYLYNAGYRKIHENAVVLTREEYEEFQVGKDFNYGVHCGENNMTAYYENIRLPEARKETAEKFAEKVHKLFNRDIKDSVVYTQEEKDILKDFCKDIDEIAKEFMGDNNGH